MKTTKTITQQSIRLILTVVLVILPLTGGQASSRLHRLLGEEAPDQVLEWNQIFIDTLVATNTANSSSQ
jgi:hypothetical protein